MKALSPAPILRVLGEPATMRDLRVAEWNELLHQARRLGVLARIGFILEEQGLLDHVPGKLRDHTLGARRLADWNQTRLRFEVNRLLHALAELEVPLVLLKGAAFLVAQLPAARGRIATDLDVMVPIERLAAVEQKMIAAGWTHLKTDAYDQHYYRAWMHELPPLAHPARNVVTDVHHTIVPRTSRLRPNATALLEAARPLSHPRLKVLAPTDMILHAATHVFHDGEMATLLRDLIDVNDLLRHFGQDDSFWQQLAVRAQLHGLKRPLYYLFRYTGLCLATPIPDAVRIALDSGAPPIWTRAAMDWLVAAVILQPPGPLADGRSNLARLLLRIRSHWLRMPPLLLARHLLVKSLHSLRAS